MRVLVMADSHGGQSEIRLALAAVGKIDCAIHLGDFSADARTLEQLAGVPVYAVRGNCDFGSVLPAETVITLENTRLFATHGHLYGVGADLYALAERAEALHCAAALYGHTHVSEIQAQGPLLLINPGSPKQPRAGRQRSVAVLEISPAGIFPKIIVF